MAGGRPKKELDWEEVDGLCQLCCTRKEIANWFEVSEDTIERRCQETFDMSFASYYEQKKSGGMISLRRRQYQAAMEGNATMLIWLGKNWLDQKDAPDSNEAKLPIKIELVKSVV